MRIPYTRLGRSPSVLVEAFPHRDYVSIPLLRFSIKHEDVTLPLTALVDSGADICIFPMEVAEALELNLSKAKSFNLVSVSGQAINMRLHPVEILFDKHRITTSVGFSTAAAGAKALGASGLLGQKGFFEHFNISFNYRDEYFEINERTFITAIKSKLP